ncbi:histamine H2 receptor-like [Ptychodera flava]|uniref:histamine H2 receptor-like n=1 Tax=Ptychodera flava TaxID=63121 RepID=UPI00396A459E
MNDSRGLDEGFYLAASPSRTYLLIQAVFLSFVMVMTVLGNIAVCYVVYRTRSVGTVTGMSITSLAIADLLRGLLVLPFVIITSCLDGEWVFGSTWCSISGFSYTLFSSASVMTLGAVSIDRYIAIVMPLKYTTIVTTLRASVLLISLWTLSVINATCPVFGWSRYIFLPPNCICVPDWTTDRSYAYFYLSTSFGLPFVVLVFCYYRIFQVARQQSRRVTSLEVSSEMPTTPMPGTSRQGEAFGTQTRKKNKTKQLNMRKEKKAAVTLFFVMGVFVICVTPYCVMYLLISYNHRTSLLLAFGIASMISFANSAANPLIYGILNRKFRHCFLDVLRCTCCPRQSVITATELHSGDYATASISLRRNRLVPRDARDSGYITTSTFTQTTSQNHPHRRPGEVFSISIAATSSMLSALGGVGGNMRELGKLAGGHLPPIDDVV